jgi:NAD(P)H-dependent flavin oxidoreductase YrpB (nitropropane dioxygenase family)
MWTTTEVSRRLRVQYPIMQGPFGGGMFTPHLVAETGAVLERLHIGPGGP